MNTTEFRIGNLMKDSLTGELLRVSELTEDNVTTTVINRAAFPLPDGWQMVPVPLTQEVLAKCGFTHNSPYSRTQGWTAPNLIFFFEGDDYCPREYSSGQPIADIDIASLHQLQNLFLDLTGKELNYTP